MAEAAPGARQEPPRSIFSTPSAGPLGFSGGLIV